MKTFDELLRMTQNQRDEYQLTENRRFLDRILDLKLRWKMRKLLNSMYKLNPSARRAFISGHLAESMLLLTKEYDKLLTEVLKSCQL